MRLSTRGRFAVTAMIDLALRERSSPVPLQDIALRHRISLSYLEQVFAKLRQQGLVESTRGPGGGYSLGRTPEQISVADILGAIEGYDADTTLSSDLSQSAQAMTQDLWDNLQSSIVAQMRTISLRSLAQEQSAKGYRVEERKSVKKGVMQKVKAMAPIRTNAPNSVFALARSMGFSA